MVYSLKYGPGNIFYPTSFKNNYSINFRSMSFVDKDTEFYN